MPKSLPIVVLAAFMAASMVSRAAAQPPQRPAQPQSQIDRNGLLILIKGTLLALDQANKTGNYTVLRDLAAPAFAATNNAARLSDIFANMRRDKIDLSGVLVLEPQLTAMPEINGAGMLHFAGFFPSAPSQINFDFVFAPVDRQWRLFGVSTTLGSSTPVAPETTPFSPAPSGPATKFETKKPWGGK